MRTSTTARKAGRGSKTSPSSERSAPRTEAAEEAETGGTAPEGTPPTPGRTSITDTATVSSGPLAGAETSSASAGDTSAGEPPPKKERGRDPLLAAICHDLRAPLAAVTMGANFVLQTTPEDEASGRSRRVLQAILRSCKQMERLVRDFGDLSEIEGGAVELRLGVHDAGLMLEMAAGSARQNALARNVAIGVRRAENAPLLRCDRDRMLRALGHVIDNAVRFTPDGGKVEVSVDEVDGKVRFQVTDHGPGLSQETLANLYDRMWHGRRADRVGAGLGLAIVRGLLEAHGGTVEVESKPNVDTTFTLTLPKDLPRGSGGELDETIAGPADTTH